MASQSLKSLNLFTELGNQRSIIDILQRCPFYIRTKWQRKALEKKSESGNYPKFDDFVDFIRYKAAESLDPLYGTDAMKRKPGKSHEGAGSCNMSGANRTSGGRSPQFSQNPCVLCKDSYHSLFRCDKFKALKVVDRKALVKQHNLCFLCLRSGHGAANCGVKYSCTVCNKRHTKFIHTDDLGSRGRDSNNDTSHSGGTNAASADHSSTNHGTNTSTGGVYLPIIPVRVNDDPRIFYCLLDSGSTNTLIEQSLASSLNLPNHDVNYKVSSLSGKSHITKAVSLTISSLDGTKIANLSNVLTVPSIPAKLPDHTIDISRYPHLADLPLHVYDTSVKARILIGLDRADLLLPLEIRSDPDCENSLYATRTKMGWALCGPVDTVTPANLACQMSNGQVNTCAFVTPETLENQVENLWHIEVDESRDKVMSPSDERVYELWEQNTEFKDGHYHIPIPFKESPLKFPDNLGMAKKRLLLQNKRLEKANLTEKYSDGIQNLLDKRYAERVPEDEIELNDGSVWYLPHFHVIHEAKGKIRIVMDCAATHLGISLNNQCYPGPNLLNNLLYILLRFRQYPYAVMADVESMYLNVRVPEFQRNALRFLYYGTNGQIVHYRMTSHLFGGVFSGSASAYALQRMCKDISDSDLVTDVISRSFYVDDLARSVIDANLAREALFGTQNVLRLGGMNLTKMIANEESVVSDIPSEHRASEVKEFKPAEIMSKALGVYWEVKGDQLLYVNRPVTHGKRLTKRVILSQVATMFDPIGLAACISIKGRMLFQELTRLKIGWDDPVPVSVANRWDYWLNSLDHLNDLKFDRCLLSSSFIDSAAQLVYFSDASERGYGSCAYIRAVNKEGHIRVALVMSKGRLSPVKNISIARLELCAAVQSIRNDVLLRREMDIPFIDSLFFTDSEIVRSYIQNEDKRYRVFVANRVAEIRRGSVPSQWFHIESSMNPADILSRGCDADAVPEIWFKGPDFLHDYKSAWPVYQSLSPVSDNDPEVISTCLMDAQILNEAQQHPLDRMIAHFSDFYRLKKAVAWMLRYQAFLVNKAKCPRDIIDAAEIKCVDRILCAHVQMTSYRDEISRISSGKSLLGSSSIAKLDSIIQDGLLRVGGLLNHSRLRPEQKHPIILMESQ